MNILLIDLSSIAHAIYHVATANPDPNATSTKTVERVRALASGQPHVGVCVEGGRSFRKDIDASYKANRPESDAALQHQIALAIDVLRADGFPILQAPGMEADGHYRERCCEIHRSRTPYRRKGDPEISLTFTIEDARRAWSKGDDAWAKSGWAKNPPDMLIARAGSKLARLVAPDVVSGLYSVEEFE